MGSWCAGDRVHAPSLSVRLRTGIAVVAVYPFDIAVMREKTRRLEQLHTEMRRRHYSYRTEQSYTQWVRQFILCPGSIHLRHRDVRGLMPGVTKVRGGGSISPPDGTADDGGCG